MRELDRVIIPEILDSLNPADPRAIRSRRDLRLIDLFLGNSRWIVRQLQKQTPLPARIIEIGAGEGTLCRKVQTARPSSIVRSKCGMPPTISAPISKARANESTPSLAR